MEPEAASPNAAQIELWNGRGGEIWTRLQGRLDELFEPLTDALMAAAAAKPGDCVVDIGCGCGDLTLKLAKACGPLGQIKSIDLSAPMIERGKAREVECRVSEPAMAPIEWCLDDAMLHRFEPSADLVTSRFGVMFFADPIAAFSNIRRALRKEGRLAFLCWATLEHNPWINVPLKAVHELIEPLPPLPEGAPGPFAFADVQRVQSILSQAGFSYISARRVETTLELGRAAIDTGDPDKSAIDDALSLALESGPVAALLRSADEATHSKARARITGALQPFYDPTRKNVALAARCWLFEASMT